MRPATNLVPLPTRTVDRVPAFDPATDGLAPMGYLEDLKRAADNPQLVRITGAEPRPASGGGRSWLPWALAGGAIALGLVLQR